MNSLTSMEYKVLRTLLKEKLKTGYDFHSGKNKIMSNSAWNKIRKHLLQEDLIKIEKEEDYPRKKKFYSLTLWGLLEALADPYTDIDSKIIAECNDLLPEIFRIWSIFVENKLEKEFKEILRRSAFSSKIHLQKTNKKEPLKTIVETFYRMLVEEFLSKIFSFIISLDIKASMEEERWIKCFEKDPYLRKIALKRIEEAQLQLDELKKRLLD